jgi:hypothetical protein
VSDRLSRRGLLRGLLAAVLGLIAPKRQARAAAPRQFSYADGPPIETRIFRYDASGRLLFTYWKPGSLISPPARPGRPLLSRDIRPRQEPPGNTGGEPRG